MSGGTGSAELYLEALGIPAAGSAGIPARGLWRRRVAQPRSGHLARPGDSTFLETPALQAAARLMDVGEASLAGARLGPYEIISLVGAGGMGEVYRARDTRLERVVAVKVLPSGDTVSPVALQRFRREARTASALNHPNICTIYDVGDDPPSSRWSCSTASPSTGGSLAALSITTSSSTRHRRSRRARRRAPDRDRPSRHQAGEHLHDAARSQDPGLRRWPRWSAGGADDDPRDRPRWSEALTDRSGTTPIGTVSYMSPEQIRGAAHGRALGPVLVRRRPLRDADRRAAVPWRQRGSDSRRHPRRRADLRPRAEDGRPAGSVAHRRQVPRERSGPAGISTRRKFWRTCSASSRAGPAIAGSTPGRRGPSHAGGRSRRRPARSSSRSSSPATPRSRARPRLTVEDTIVLADFTNTTGDPVFDETLRQGVATQLEQSPFVRLVSQERLQRTLRMMGQPPEARLTPRSPGRSASARRALV